MRIFIEKPSKVKFQSFIDPKMGYITYKPNLKQTFIETFMKPHETFFSFFETFVTSEVSIKFHDLFSLSPLKSFIYPNTPIFNETWQVSTKNALISLYAHKLGVNWLHETFKWVVRYFHEIGKLPPNLFRQTIKKFNSLSESFKPKLI